jgi:hypothetical protein
MNSVTSARRWLCPPASVLDSFLSTPHTDPLNEF